MPPDLSWLIGKRLIEAAKKDFTWFFVFSDGGNLAMESQWRLVTKEGIAVTSEDHGHMFGLKVPVDAGARALAATRERKVLAYRIADRTSDLIVTFEDEVSLEFLNLSCGYESWRAEHDSDEVICLGGGGWNFSRMKKKLKGARANDLRRHVSCYRKIDRNETAESKS